MYAINSQSKNIGSVLSDIVDKIEKFDHSVDVYLKHIGQREILNPIQSGIQIDYMGNNDSIPSEFFDRFGIRSLVLNAFHGRLALGDQYQLEDEHADIMSHKWQNIKNEVMVEDLKMLFRNCPIIHFADWATVYDASDFWDGILDDVIRPLGRKDFEFVFYLGDITNKFSFEVDEIIDIIRGFSYCGRGTLVLDKREADKLYSLIYNQDTEMLASGFMSTRSKEQYASLFNVLGLDIMIIFGIDYTILFSSEEQFHFRGKTLNYYTAPLGKDYFNAGYQLGLLLHLEISNCIALGLIVSGAYLQNKSRPGKEELIIYLKNWIAEVEALINSKNEFVNFVRTRTLNHRLG